MKRKTGLLAAAALSVSAGQHAFAYPTRSYTCVACHGSSSSDGYNDTRLTLLNTSGSANPTERTGATDRGTLPIYQITAGTSKVLSLQTSGAISPNNGFITNNYQKPGVVGGNTLTLTADSAWYAQSNAAGAFWYRTSYSAATTYSF